MQQTCRMCRWVLVLLVGLLVACAAPAPATPPFPTQGWQVSTPAAQGMDAAMLDTIDTLVAERYGDVQEVLIIRNGQIVFERGYHGHAPGEYHAIASITKSIVAALIGTLIQQGQVQINQPVAEFFPSYLTPASDPRKHQITVEHLLMMSGGWQWQPDAALAQALGSSSDQRRTMFDLPLEADPGTQFRYKPVDSHLLAAIVAHASGTNTLAYATDALFAPLGITPDAAAGFAWEQDAQGYYMGPAGLYMTARDLAKIGYLYLRQGQWDGVQLIPADYIAASTRTQTNGDWSDAGDVTYGYHWWVAQHADHAAYFAAGYGGQFLYVIPDLDLVVVILSDVERSARDVRSLIDQAIIPAVQQ